MAIIQLKKNADMEEVQKALQELGITKGQRLDGGRMVVYINRRRWLCMQYPALEPLYAADRAFWKEVRRRTRNGEAVPQEEIEAHTAQFNKRFNQIIASYEK